MFVFIRLGFCLPSADLSFGALHALAHNGAVPEPEFDIALSTSQHHTFEKPSSPSQTQAIPRARLTAQGADRAQLAQPSVYANSIIPEALSQAWCSEWG